MTDRRDQVNPPTTLKGVLRRHLWAYVAGAVMLAAFQLCMNRVDWLAKATIDIVFGDHPELVWRPAGSMLALAVAAFATRVASRWFMLSAGRNVEYELRATLLTRIHSLGATFYRKMSSGEIMSRSTGDLLQVRMLVGFGVLSIVNVIFAFASALQVMLGISLRLSLASFVITPVLILFTRSLARSFFEHMRNNQTALGRLTELVQSNLAGVRVIRSFALERGEVRRFETANRHYLDAGLAVARLRGAMGPILGAASAASSLVSFWYGGTLLLKGPELGGITPGEFFAFQLALARMMWPMITLGFAVSMIQRGRAGFARLREIFDAVPDVVDGPLPVPVDANPGISIVGLTFAHGGHQALDGITLSLPAGESVAVMGRTGSGKSTLAMLLARLLPTPRGTVFIGGHDVCDLPLSFVRQRIGYVQQDAFLFSTTVTRNIGFSLDNPDSAPALERIRDAARQAEVLEETLALPDGFDTVVGERGVQLSGGQRQRIALARAFAWAPPILVLDDPLSAVDAKTEVAILAAIQQQSHQRAVLLITHRVAAAAKCDRIIVLDQGRIVESGQHDDLVRAKGIYAGFAEEQSIAAELDEVVVA